MTNESLLNTRISPDLRLIIFVHFLLFLQTLANPEIITKASPTLITLMKKYFRKVSGLLILLSIFPGLKAQEMFGLINSNYSGIHGAIINPSSLTNSKYYLDINFLTLGISFENNYIYLAKGEYKFSRFLGKNLPFPTHGIDAKPAYDYYNTKPKDAFLNERLMGPSVMLNIGKHAFGITTSFRTVSSAKNIPYEIAKFGYEGLDYTDQFGINYIDNKKFGAAAISWAELGLSYAYVFKQDNLEYWSGGITIKPLLGVSAAYAKINNLDYNLTNRDTVTINNLDAIAGYSLPIDYATNDFLRTPVFHGSGVGFDIGITYQKMKKGHQNTSYNSICAIPYKPYLYRIGLSIIDIGSISFKKNAQYLVFDNVNTYWPEFRDINYQNVNSAVSDISRQFYNGDSTKLLQGNKIKVGLPTAFSFQLDVNYTGNWYINGTIIYPLAIYKAGIIRPAQLAITPRFETNYFGVDLPLSLYDFKRPRIGICARIGFLTIGTDKIGGFFNFNDFTGLDFYFAIKWSFLKGHCRLNAGDYSCGNNEYKKFSKK